MNIHPLFVHFPLALLTIYALLEMLSPWIDRKMPWIKATKILLLLLGSLALLPTLMTGDEAAHLIGETPLIERHEMFAQLTTLLFALLSGAYALGLLKYCKFGVKVKELLIKVKLWSLLWRVRGFILLKSVRLSLAALALLSVTITGALGAAIVYGTASDPIVSLIYNLVM